MRKLLVLLSLLVFAVPAFGQVEINASGGFVYDTDAEVLTFNAPNAPALGAAFYFGPAMLLQTELDLSGTVRSEGENTVAVMANFCPEYYFSTHQVGSPGIRLCGGANLIDPGDSEFNAGGGIMYRFCFGEGGACEVTMTVGVDARYFFDTEVTTVPVTVRMGYVLGN